MNKKQLEKILILIFKERELDDKKQETIEKFTEVFAPNEYSPILEGSTAKLLEMLKILDEGLEDWASYFLYEAPSFYKRSGFVTVEIDDISYHISSDTGAITFILNNIFKDEKI